MVLIAVMKNISVELQEKHEVVLRGLLMRNPDMTMSDLLAEALEPFCRKHSGAANECEVLIEVISSGDDLPAAIPEPELV